MNQALQQWPEAKAFREEMRRQKRPVVFTNGCFDILHAGHVELLESCRRLGDCLMVGLNSDASVRRLKGERRPIIPLEDRARVLAALRSVDAVVAFEQDTPAELIRLLEPDVLAKGGDWSVEDVVGADTVIQGGGRVEIIPLLDGRSTTGVVERVVKQYCENRGA